MFAVPGWAVDASTLVHEEAKSRDAKKARTETTTRKRKQSPERSNAQPFAKALHPRPQENRVAHSKHSRGLTNAVSERKSSLSPRSLDKSVHSGQGLEPRTKKPKKNVSSRSTNRVADAKSIEGAKEPRRLVRAVESETEERDRPVPIQSAATNVKLTPLQAKMRSKLTSARFRHLNETLYTSSSGDALAMFANSPDLFADYHAGFAQQVKESWPQNPVEGYVRAVKLRGALTEPARGVQPLPRRKTGSCTIADLGCGDAPLARGCQANIKTLKLRFHNYDLHAANTFVTKADMANLPLRDGEIDIVVFCLSLMGTNWVDFIEEAWRILRGDGKGEVWVAEVKSRFGRATKGRVVENSVGKRTKFQKRQFPKDDDEYDVPEQFVEDERNGAVVDDETDVSAFVKVFTRRGFQLREGSVNKSNKMFVSMVLTKSGIPTAGKHKGLKWNGKEYIKQHDGKMRLAGGQADNDDVTPDQEAKVLKPCVYKTR